MENYIYGKIEIITETLMGKLGRNKNLPKEILNLLKGQSVFIKEYGYLDFETNLFEISDCTIEAAGKGNFRYIFFPTIKDPDQVEEIKKKIKINIEKEKEEKEEENKLELKLEFQNMGNHAEVWGALKKKGEMKIPEIEISLLGIPSQLLDEIGSITLEHSKIMEVKENNQLIYDKYKLEHPKKLRTRNESDYLKELKSEIIYRGNYFTFRNIENNFPRYCEIIREIKVNNESILYLVAETRKKNIYDDDDEVDPAPDYADTKIYLRAEYLKSNLDTNKYRIDVKEIKINKIPIINTVRELNNFFIYRPENNDD